MFIVLFVFDYCLFVCYDGYEHLWRGVKQRCRTILQCFPSVKVIGTYSFKLHEQGKSTQELRGVN